MTSLRASQELSPLFKQRKEDNEAVVAENARLHEEVERLTAELDEALRVVELKERDTQRPLLEALLEAALAEGGAGEEPIAVRAWTRTRDLDPRDGSGHRTRPPLHPARPLTPASQSPL